MTLTPGTMLGPYKISAALGAGGMGEVYRAFDARLGRDVAIKVLPNAFSKDDTRLQRFAVEAKAASALNHPNILTIFDIGSFNEAPYLVCELLEGLSLREVINESGKLPLRRLVDYSVQIASGLSAAHQRGIIHRDLKPENIFVCKDGRAKILDFGLAKLIEPTSAAPDGATMSATDPGTVLGTVGYMSPEQVRGQSTDARSDIFSFGAILYEMLAGQKAFSGTSSADIASAILKDEPKDLIEINPQVVPAMDRIVQHCLEKDASERFQSAKDLAFALRSVSSSSESSVALRPVPKPSRTVARTALWGALALAVVLSALWLGRLSAVPSRTHRVAHSQRLTDFLGIEQYPAVSPDGKSLAFISDSGGSRQLWVRLLGGGIPLQITHDAGDHLFPRWARDSASIIYYTPPAPGQDEGTLWEISTFGGFPRQITDSISGADLDHAGKRLTFFRLEKGIVKLISSDRDGSNPRSVFEAPLNSKQPSFGFSFPRWSPDDKWIAYQHASAMWADDLYVVSSAGGAQPRRITYDAKLISGLTWTSDGSSIVYSSAQGTTVLYLPSMQLWMIHPDGSEPIQLTYDDVVYEYPDVSGSKMVASRRLMQFDLWKYPTGGDPAQNVAQGIRLTQQSGRVFTPAVSPDDSEVAFLSDSGGHGNIWVKNLRNGDLRQVTFEQDPHVTIGTPVWSPVSREIAFATTHIGQNWANVGYSVVNSDGSNLHNVVTKGAWAAWSADGKYLYYAESLPTEATPTNRLMKIPAKGGEPIPVRNDGATGPAPSANGAALYYVLAQENLTGGLDFELRAAEPENAPSRLLARIAAVRSPQWQGLHPTLAHSGKWLALPLNDSYGTNIWLVSTTDGALRPLTDFGQQRTFIVRRVSWSSDDKYMFAAVATGQEDIVLLDGMLPETQR